MPGTTRPISATAVSRYIRMERCGRFLRFVLHPDEAKRLTARYDVAPDPLNPLLAEHGQAYEARIVATLPGPVIDLNNQPAMASVAALHAIAPGGSAFLTQARLEGQIGGWDCLGIADIIHARRRADGVFDLAVMDVKSSTHDNVEYRVQVAFYMRLLRQMTRSAGLALGEISGAILHPDAQGAPPDYRDPALRFAVAPYDLVLDHLFDGPASDLARITSLAIADIPYALGPKCDGCAFNRLCLRESAERQDVALTPTIRAADIQALKAAGVKTLRDLAELKQLPPVEAERAAFPVMPGKESIVAALNANQVVAARLDRLVQRARACLRRFDPAVQSYPFLLDAPPSQLPSDEENPYLVKIFLDAQHDYLRDRIYLAGARLVGPGGERAFVHISDGPPTDRDEEHVLLALVRDVVAALPEVAGDPTAQRVGRDESRPYNNGLPSVANAFIGCPFHIYLYDPFEQRIWLDALSRHMDALCAVPAFYDLLTTNGGVDELMFAFLAQEIRDRRNLGMTCQNLYNVAAIFGFAWQDERHNFRQEFRDRVFDGAARREDGVWVEQRSQFNSHIPLEYAYGAWGALPATQDARMTWRYRRCTRQMLAAFHLHRLRAMQHIEARLNPKHPTGFIKTPLPFAAVAEAEPLRDLARALDEFLGMEHHASVQGKLALFLLPFARRVQTGRCLPLRCLRLAANSKHLTVTCALDYAAAGLDPATARLGSRVKVGDWMLLNPVTVTHPREILRGRIAVVREMGREHEDHESFHEEHAQDHSDIIVIDLLDMTSFDSAFKYPHNTDFVPVVGEIYALDEMADDLNADKYQQAVFHAANNRIYAAVSADATTQDVPPAPRGLMFLNAMREADPTLRLTEKQAEVVAGMINAPLLCVQGPPGTGKTATLGWAVLARIFATDERPMRVLVCAKTHKATNLVLGSVAERLNKIRRTNAGKSIGDVRIYKVSSDDGAELPGGVRRLHPYYGGRVRGVMSDGGVTIIGGTPGGIFSLMRTWAGKALPWGDGPFDLLVIDEASQMNIPEALLAGAFLSPDARIIVVGDHRQMPPILAHPWPEERKRTAQTHKPAQSIFEALLERKHPKVPLDESFRLHRTQARFLAEHIYSQDGIDFRSNRHDVLPSLPPGYSDPFVAAALNPAYPIVVIEHSETGSQQFNATELDLIAPIARACVDALRLDGHEGVGIVVPHNAQKAALRHLLPELDAAGAIDTVERFQGGERDVIIVSATASDPDYIMAEADFLLNRNRLNVAFSRPRKKLIVLASQTLFRFLCGDLALFEQALLWKYLRYAYADALLWRGTAQGVAVEVRGHHAEHAVHPVAPDVQAVSQQRKTPRAADALEERSCEA